MIDVIVDVEADGPTPVLNSMLEVGAITLDLRTSFNQRFRPLDGMSFDPAALTAIGQTREQTLAYPISAEESTRHFVDWLDSLGDRLVFWSDNPAFDWQFVNAYLWRYVGRNPFGYSARRIGDFYAGMLKDKSKHTVWKHLRKTKHTHNALDDATGNAEALAEIIKRAMLFRTSRL